MPDPLDYEAVEANDPAVIPAPEIDPTAIVYIPENEVPITEDFGDEEEENDSDTDCPDLWGLMFERLKSIDERVTQIEQTQESLKSGVNTIGEMMNGVASVFDELMQKVQQGGIGALLGGFMGGKKIDG